MYAFSDETSRSEAPSRSLLDHPGLTLDSLSVDAGHGIFNQPNIICPSSADSSVSEAPLTPTFGGGVFDDDGRSSVAGTLHQLNPLVFQMLESSPSLHFPDTPAAELPPDNNQNHQQFFSSQTPNNELGIFPHLADGESGQTTMFQFPDVNDSLRSSSLFVSMENASSSLSSTGVTPPTTALIPDHVFEEPQLSLLDTPPTTPNQNSVLGNRALWAECQSQKQPRPRLGGVSAFSLTGDNLEFDGLDGLEVLCDLDLSQTWSASLEMPLADQQQVFHDAVSDRPEPEAAASGTSKQPEEQIQHLDDNNDQDTICDFSERDNNITRSPSRTEHRATAVSAKTELEADVEGVASRSLEESLPCGKSLQSAEPMLKKELRRKIMKRRHDSGMEEQLQDTARDPQPQPEYQMTDSDYARRDARREQNRWAAKRFREKMKKKHSDTTKKLEEAEETNRRLSGEVEVLRDEVSRLRVEVERHRHCGDCRLLQAARGIHPGLPDCRAGPLCQHADRMEDVDPRPR